MRMGRSMEGECEFGDRKWNSADFIAGLIYNNKMHQIVADILRTNEQPKNDHAYLRPSQYLLAHCFLLYRFCGLSEKRNTVWDRNAG